MTQDRIQKGIVTSREQLEADLHAGDWSCPQFLARTAAAAGPDLLVVADPLARVRYASSAAERILGYQESDRAEMHILHYVHPDDSTSVLSALGSAAHGSYHEPVAVRIANAQGAWVDCEVNARAVDGPGGVWTVLALRGLADRTVVQDRSADLARLVHRASLECTHARWYDCDEIAEHLTRSLAGILGAGVVELAWNGDQDNDEVMRTGIHWAARSDDGWSEPDRGVSEEFEPFGFHETSDSTVTRLRDLSPDCEVWARSGYGAAGLDSAVEILVSPCSPKAMIRLGFSDGGRRWRSIHAEAVGQIALVLMSTLRRCEAERQLEERARRDSLTGLVNREELYRRLSECIARAGASPGSVGVIYGDLDCFKQVNDRFGHAVGDGVLKSVARVLSESLRDGDFAARSGGDEFVVVCSGLRSSREAAAIARRIQSGVSELRVGDTNMAISVGCAVNDGSVSADELVSLADSAMYANKRAAVLAGTHARIGGRRSGKMRDRVVEHLE